MSAFLRRVQRGSYLLSRAAGDVNAAQRGPTVLGKRLARRAITRNMFRIFNNGRTFR